MRGLIHSKITRMVNLLLKLQGAYSIGLTSSVIEHASALSELKTKMYIA